MRTSRSICWASRRSSTSTLKERSSAKWTSTAGGNIGRPMASIPVSPKGTDLPWKPDRELREWLVPADKSGRKDCRILMKDSYEGISAQDEYCRHSEARRAGAFLLGGLSQFQSLAEFASADAKNSESFLSGIHFRAKIPLAERTVRAKRVRGAQRDPLSNRNPAKRLRFEITPPSWCAWQPWRPLRQPFWLPRRRRRSYPRLPGR